jgi:hypothetical protein
VQELINEWADKGRAEQSRRLLHNVLALRALAVTPDVRARIAGESDVARLESWHAAAVKARTIGDVFRDRAAPAARRSPARRSKPAPRTGRR